MALSKILAHGSPPGHHTRTLLLSALGLVYTLVSLVNHYNFRTGSFDLGIIGQALQQVANGQAPHITLLLDAPPTSYLASHFSLTPALALPLTYVVGPAWALLLLQLVAVLLGGVGSWHYAHAQGASPREANYTLALFGCQWGIFSALSFDYHDNVVGAMALPWLALWVGQGRAWPALAATLLILLSKENMALWVVFVLLGLAWQQRHYRRRVLVLCLGALGALGYYVVITGYVMPALDTTHRPFTQLVRYTHLGPTLPAAVWRVLTNPRVLWDVLFCNTLSDPTYHYIKLETWAALLLSGGWALWCRPWYLLMLLPILGQKLLANDYVLWGINAQYSIEFAPVLTLAVADVLLRGRAPTHPAGWRDPWAWALACTVAFTVVTLFVRRSVWYDSATANLLQIQHYRSPYASRAQLARALAHVPAHTPLSTSSRLVPHLLNRPAIFLFPVLRTARLVLLPRHPDTSDAWPLTPLQMQHALADLRTRPGYSVLHEDAQVVLLARTITPHDSAEVWKNQVTK